MLFRRSFPAALTTTIGTSASIVDGIKSAVAQMVANNGYQVRPTAIYANPVLLDLIDREMKTSSTSYSTPTRSPAVSA